jgi:OPA family glycerol-3-phosphate transporter-like MFS transporter
LDAAAETDWRLRRWQFATLALLVTGYAGCYLCRSNLSVAMPEIAAGLVEQGYAADEARLALGGVVSLGVLAYALGKFVTGSVADFLGGRRNMLGGMLGSVLFTALFAVSGTVPLFTLAWFGNRAVQSFCWAGMVKITGRWFSYSAYGTAMGVISLSYLFGDAAARWFMGLLFEAGMDWRQVFWAAGGVLLALFVVNLIWLRESPRAIGLEEPPANPLNVYGAQGEVTAPPPSLRSLLVPLLTSWEFLVVCALSLGLTLLRETFNAWSPTYFVEVTGSSSARAAAQSALFPLLGGASVLVAGWLGDRLGATGRSAVILGGCSLAVGVLWLLSSVEAGASAFLPVWLVGLAGFLILGPYSYLAGAISLDLGGKRGGATACGIIDGVGYLGAMMAGDSVARLSVSFGWSGAFRALAGVALLTSLAAAVFFALQRRKVGETQR